MTWVIQPGISLEDSGQAVTRVEGTFQYKTGCDYTSIQEYLSERAGWVTPLMRDFTNLYQAADRGEWNHAARVGDLVTQEFCEIAGVPMSLQAYRQSWDRTQNQTTIGRNIRKHARQVRRDQQPHDHLVVWFHPSYHMPDDELGGWLNDCRGVIDGFVDERMETADLEWDYVSSWLAVIHTPWATFATLRKPYKHFNRKYEARVRHLVLDPVILATAHHSFVQRFVGQVAELNSYSPLSSGGECRKARDEFYQWRSAYWWAQPAKATIPNRVWRGAVEANNTVSQVDSLSQEMSDYAAVEDVRHNQKVERHNQRLAWGGLVFALLAIVLPVVQSVAGIGWTAVAAGGVLATVGALYVGWSFVGRLRRRDL